MKKSYLWIGLAVPAAAGGVIALLKTKKGARFTQTKKENNKEIIPDQTPVQEMLAENPDLDKDLNQMKNEKPEVKTHRTIRASIRKELEQSSKSTNGKKIYTGVKGGKYYLNDKGEKVYLKK